MPRRPYRNIAVDPDLHRALKIEAAKRGVPIGTLVRQIAKGLWPDDEKTKKRAA